jgi:hypothetical protein
MTLRRFAKWVGIAVAALAFTVLLLIAAWLVYFAIYAE